MKFRKHARRLKRCAKAMISNSTQPFRFMDLPGELRNQVYTLLLCSFGPPVEQTVRKLGVPIASAGHRAETAILLTSRQVYLEAYDVMVKANRFVVVRAFPPIPVMDIIRQSVVTVITYNDLHISQFKGHILSVTLSMPAPSHEPPMSVMLLARDLPSFCEKINRCTLNNTLIVDVDVAPLLGEHTSLHKDSFDAFVSEEIQLSLLAPFKTHMRGLKNVRVHGRVSPGLAIATAKDMCQNEWSDPTELLHQLQSLKEHAAAKWQDGSRTEGSREGRTWSPSWARYSKLLYRQALVYLLLGSIGNADGALTIVECALERSPNDTPFLELRGAILRWIASGCDFDADRASVRIHMSDSGDITVDMTTNM
ncbi:uncharacterized protein J4E84_002230 [Alternaria hordeiaustralica]|uniref:uncharacterized protein n=1 Tax=Alternaria hordeiaustralica TaxID=1187925 RepID=UPI0020C5B1C4|nr:uncharacterized protein J4E84_002230 [Alternaria hordeiaustralica]KAI4693656.1 hypothetical protein J4E84_002230 [Alternaria hordeiaustralica]